MIKTVKVFAVIVLVCFGFFITSYTNTHDIRDIPKQLSRAQESLSKLINTLISDKKSDLLPPVNLALTNTVFPLGENIVLQYDGDIQSFKDLHIDLKNIKNESTPIRTSLKDGKFLQIELSKKISQGMYTLMIKQDQRELINANLYLGMIVVNNQQFQYTTGEKYISNVAIFDNDGILSCKSKPTFAITNTLSGASDVVPVEEIKCDEKNNSPYRLSYTPKITGTYILKNKTEGTNTALIAISAFNVTDASPPIVVKRESPIFVQLSKKYEVKITITVREDFEGILNDFVPAGFTVSNTDNFSVQSPLVTFDESSLRLRKPFDADFPVTLKFGENTSDLIISQGYKNFGIIAHDGIDFALPDNTPILAVDDGKVVEFPSKLSAYGTNVVLEHPWGGRTFYGHLNSVSVKIGQKVGRGDSIGLSGHTGLATGPHLHFGLDLKNSDVNNGYLGKIDPTKYIPSENNDLASSVQKLTWNISIKKGEKKQLGYVFSIPEEDYGYQYFELGPIYMEQKNGDIVFKDGGKWTLIKELGFVQNE